MKPNPTKLAKDLLRDLIRDTESAVDLIGNLRDQADSDGNESAASVLLAIWQRLNHAGDEFRTAEAIAKAGGRSKQSPQPVGQRSLPV